MRREDNPFNLCQQHFADGRQCCMPATADGFCRSHSEMNRFQSRSRSPEEDLSASLSEFYSQETGALDVHHALQEIFQALAANRITTRRAATLGYLGQLILLSKPDQDSQSLSKRDLRKMSDLASSLLRTAYAPKPKRSMADRELQRPPIPPGLNYNACDDRQKP